MDNNFIDDDDGGDFETAKSKKCTSFRVSFSFIFLNIIFQDGEPPRTYFENTSKEELVLEHVLEYKR